MSTEESTFFANAELRVNTIKTLIKKYPINQIAVCEFS